MLPRTLCLLNTRIEGDRLLPRYLGERDHPWLLALLDEHARCVGRPRSELVSRLGQALPVVAPKNKLRLATRVLDRLTLGRIDAEVSPQRVRSCVFGARAASPESRQSVLERAAAELGSSARALEAALFADLRGERRVAALPDDYSPSRFALEINAALVAGLLARAAHVRIRAWGNTPALVRHARHDGLICLVRHATADDATSTVLEISGPFALFRHTAIYARALAGLVPRLAACDGFELVASCMLTRDKRVSSVIVRSGDPITAGRELGRLDGRIGARWAADLCRAAPDWELICEPAPFACVGGPLFPDFELVHRGDPARRWRIEIAGFWTRDYLDRKLEQLRSAGAERWVVCVDETKGCGSAAAPSHAQLLYYKKRLDPTALLAVIEG